MKINKHQVDRWLNVNVFSVLLFLKYFRKTTSALHMHTFITKNRQTARFLVSDIHTRNIELPRMLPKKSVK